MDCSSQMNPGLFPREVLEFLIKEIVLLKVASLREAFVHRKHSGDAPWSSTDVKIISQIAKKIDSKTEQRNKHYDNNAKQKNKNNNIFLFCNCLLYTSPSPRDA